jgi:hypothetical protein
MKMAMMLVENYCGIWQDQENQAIRASARKMRHEWIITCLWGCGIRNLLKIGLQLTTLMRLARPSVYTLRREH